MRWLKGVMLIFGLWLFVMCTNSDVPVVPTSEQLQDGEWTGSGEGRSGSIIIEVTVENHQVAKVTVVSQSESTFAQEAINTICESAIGRTEEMGLEVDGVTGATLTSKGVIDAINMALQASMGKSVDPSKIYKDGSCDIVVIGAGGAGLSAAVAATDHLFPTSISIPNDGAPRASYAKLVLTARLQGVIRDCASPDTGMNNNVTRRAVSNLTAFTKEFKFASVSENTSFTIV